MSEHHVHIRHQQGNINNDNNINNNDNNAVMNTSISITQRIMAASTGAIVTSLMMTPMDVVKIRLQQQRHPFVKGTCFLYSNGLMDHLCTACADSTSKQPCEWFAKPGNFTGTIDAFIKITKLEGIRSLWSGLSPTLVMAVPATVLYFSTYDGLLHWLRSLQRRNNNDKSVDMAWWSPMLAGSVARTLATTIVSPIEMVRTKMQSERLTYCEIGLAIKRSHRADGLLSFWRGWAPTLMRDLPFSAIYWTCYECLKRNALKRLNRSETTFSISFLSGAASGSLAAFLTAPFDVVKTHRQITLGQMLSHHDPNKANVKSVTTSGIIKELIHKNGFRAIFAGVVPRIAKISPACAIMIGSYEYIKALFAHRNLNKSL